MPSPGKSKQRGFVRHIGITPSRRDRKNKRDPAVVVVPGLPPEKSEQQIKLEWLQAEHPELYEQAKVFAGYHDGYSEAEKVDLMITCIEKALAEAVRHRHEEQLHADYDKARAEA